MTRLRLLLTAILLLIAPASARADCRDCTLNGKPVNTSHGGALKGKKGTLRCVDDTGRVCREETIVDGQPNGPQTYYRNGVVTEIINMKDGKRHGKRKQFGPDGKISWEHLYENGRPKIERSYHRSGKLRTIKFNLAPGYRSSGSATFNEKGQLTGLTCHKQIGWASLREACGYGGKPGQVTLHYEDGKEKVKKTYVDGEAEEVTRKTRAGVVKSIRGSKKDGPFKEFYDSGKLLRQGQRKGGQLVELKEYHESGKLIRDSRFEEGKLVSQKEFYLNGRVKEESSFSGPGRKQSKVYHDNGKPAEVGEYVARGRYGWTWWVEEGEFSYYYEDGTPSAKVSYQDGYRHGTEKCYDGKGRLSSVSTWDKGSLRSYKSYSPKGKLIKVEEYLPDGSRKKHAR